MSSIALIPLFVCPDETSSLNKKLTELDRAQVPSDVPQVPAMADETARLETFSSPFFDSDKSVEELAQAGFFFLGPHHNEWYVLHDLTRCFWCGTLFACWFKNDDVLKMHTERRPDCQFIRNRRCIAELADLKAMFQRWTSSAPVNQLVQLGVNRDLLDRAMDRIFVQCLPFPPDFVSLYRFVSSIAEESVTDSLAGGGDIKCASCENSAIMMYQPCGHVIACGSCSRTQGSCAECGAAVQSRVVARLA